MLWWNLKQLKSNDDRKRNHAVAKLGRSRKAKAVEPLISALKDYRDATDEKATEALVQLGGVAVEPLIAALMNSDSRVRIHSTNAKVQIGS